MDVATGPVENHNNSGRRYYSFVSGALGGAISSVALQPLDVLKTRLQASAASAPRELHSRNLFHIGQNLVKVEGLSALWSGTGAVRYNNSIE